MESIKKFLGKEKNLFSILVILQVVPLWFITYFPSMDGAQHLYNSQVIVQLIKQNPVFQEFYIINPVLVGYWSGHFFLSLFNYLFPASIAENLLISGYLIGLAFAFRYLVTAINPKPSYLTILIVPFSYTFYFIMGYYSFSIAFIFFFLAYGFYLRIQHRFTFFNFLILCVLIFSLFLSHAFVFACFGLSIFAYLAFELISNLIKRKSFKDEMLSLLKKGAFIALASAPSVIFFLIYINHVMKIDSTVVGDRYDFGQLVDFIVRIRALIGYHMGRESYANYIYLLVIITAFNYVIHKLLLKIKTENLNRSKVLSEIFNSKNIWLFVSLFFLVIYFSMPDRVSAGNLVSRIAIVFFYFLIVWIASSKVSKKLSFYLIIIVLLVFMQQSFTRYKSMQRLSLVSKEVKYLSNYVDSNTIVFSYRVSNHWVDLHFPLYLGVDKPLIMLANPQCAGQFPVIWNQQKLPIIMLGDKNVTNQHSRNVFDFEGRKVVQVDYVLVYRYNEFLESPEHKEMKQNLKDYYRLKAISPEGYAALFYLKYEQ